MTPAEVERALAWFGPESNVVDAVTLRHGRTLQEAYRDAVRERDELKKSCPYGELQRKAEKEAEGLREKLKNLNKAHAATVAQERKSREGCSCFSGAIISKNGHFIGCIEREPWVVDMRLERDALAARLEKAEELAEAAMVLRIAVNTGLTSTENLERLGKALAEFGEGKP